MWCVTRFGESIPLFRGILNKKKGGIEQKEKKKELGCLISCLTHKEINFRVMGSNPVRRDKKYFIRKKL